MREESKGESFECTLTLLLPLVIPRKNLAQSPCRLRVSKETRGVRESGTRVQVCDDGSSACCQGPLLGELPLRASMSEQPLRSITMSDQLKAELYEGICLSTNIPSCNI